MHLPMVVCLSLVLIVKERKSNWHSRADGLRKTARKTTVALRKHSTKGFVICTVSSEGPGYVGIIRCWQRAP